MKTTKEIENSVEIAANQFKEYYLDWLNNFLTVDGYAEHYGLTESQALQRIRIGKTVHNRNHKES